MQLLNKLFSAKKETPTIKMLPVIDISLQIMYAARECKKSLEKEDLEQMIELEQLLRL